MFSFQKIFNIYNHEEKTLLVYAYKFAFSIYFFISLFRQKKYDPVIIIINITTIITVNPMHKSKPNYC